MQIEKIKTTYNPETELSVWHSEQPVALVHILHGMGEHKNRYHEFARFLANNNIQVYAHDHPGHGSQITEQRPAGHFGDQNGFQNVLELVHDVQLHIRDSHPELPVFILGHSMGSFIAQHYLMSYQMPSQGMILSGSAHTPRPLLHALRLVAMLESIRLGKSAYSKLIDKLSFSSYNKSFKPQRTDYDWLSRDTETVDKYIDDELCGFILGTQSWKELASGLLYISDHDNIKTLAGSLPLAIVSGDKDPVGGFGKYVQALADSWQKAGHQDLDLILLEDARHEVLNESNRESTYNALLQWILRQTGDTTR